MIEIPNFNESDNETRVREALLVPLLNALEYTFAETLPEYPVGVQIRGREQAHFRADYLLQVQNRFGLPTNHVVIEVKRPSVSLDKPEVLDQARVYATYREIEATYVVLTNGRRIQVFSTSGPQLNRLRDYDVTSLTSQWQDVQAVLGANSLRSHFAGMKILDRIGAGGFGEVFAAEHVQLKRMEALKVLYPGSESAASIRQRFEQGAIAIARLDHKFLCRVFDLGIYRGRVYYRMELIDGVGLLEHLDRSSPSLLERITLFEQICEGLCHAHENEVIHCDLKPSNVMVLADGSPKLIDFDYCHLGGDVTTLASQVAASIAYADPAVWTDPRFRDVRADIYSLGLLLWSTLVGKGLIPGWARQDLAQEIRELGGNADQYLSIIFHCLRMDRSKRPESVHELLRLLRSEPASSLSLEEADLDEIARPFGSRSPEREFEYFFRIWREDTGNLPAAKNFERIIVGIPKRVLTPAEQEFLFRSACSHWSVRHRTAFEGWEPNDLVRATRIVVSDRSLNAAQQGRSGDAHPARQAMALLGSVDPYLNPSESRIIGAFLLDWLPQERRVSVLNTGLSTLTQLVCMRQKASPMRRTACETLRGMVDDRLNRKSKGSARDIKRIIGFLDPEKCGTDTKDLALFAKKLTEASELRTSAINLLGTLKHEAATDAFLSLLHGAGDALEFEKIAQIGIGIRGRYRRTEIAQYLLESPRHPPSDALQAAATAISEGKV